MKKENNRFLTTGQVAKMCGVSKTTAATWFDLYELGHLVPGSRHRRFCVEKLNVFLNEKKINVNQEGET